MSALIIASHVKEGIEMAEEIDLPQEIIDIIPQHHGTKLITYFYEKAKERQDPSLGDVSEEEFRYPGPKPQTKEAGIIMIADGVEAAARTLEEPSPARLKGVIRQIIDYIFLDGQLDECDLTLRDLERISQSFLRVLMGMHHHRVDYPGFDFEKKVEPVVVQDQNKKVRGVGADR
jgi:membrane-associated HD superfamily phosphohydrolase